ncbi:TPA: hypothetical protein ACH3X2_010124 [Trebouxia sp. C0005]
MRLAIFGLISLVAVHTVCRAQVQDVLVQEIEQLIANSSWTVPFSNYITADELPPGQSLEVATVSQRLCGAGFVNSSGQVNVALLQDISEVTFVNITTYYYVDVLKATEAQAANVISASSAPASTLNLTAYDCVDLQLKASVFRAASLVDFGATLGLGNMYQEDSLRNQGWAVSKLVTTNFVVDPAAVTYLRRMPIAPSASFNFTLQVFSSDLLCCTVEDQSLVLSLMSLLLTNHTYLITIRVDNATSYDVLPAASSNYSYAANFTLTASSSTYYPVASLETAVQAVLADGTASIFSQQMLNPDVLNSSVNAVAYASNFQPFAGDSFAEQVADYVDEKADTDKVPLGVTVGVSVVGAAILAATAALAFHVLRHKRQNRQQKAKLAAVLQTSPDLQLKHGIHPGLAKASLEELAGSSGSSSPVELTSVPIVGQWLGSEGGAAQPWDLDPAEITICKRPDGSDWVLGIGSFGQVVKGLRGGVQDVALKMLIGETHYHMNSFRQEIEILKSLSFDRSIVQFYGTCPWQGKTMLVLEHMGGGDLRHALTQAPAELHWYNKGASVALDIIKGLHFLHKHMVVHMDMKPKNVLLTPDYSIAKIADVGLAHIMGNTAQGSQAMGTFAYAAPEQLLNKPCDEKVDIYSFGVLLWELVTATPPIRGRLRPIKVPAECPQDIADLVEHCLSMEPQSRPSARDVFNVITTVQLAQEQQAAQDPWDAREGPPHVASGNSHPPPVPRVDSLQQPGHSRHQAAARRHERNHDSVQQAVTDGSASYDGFPTAAASPVGVTLDRSSQVQSSDWVV